MQGHSGPRQSPADATIFLPVLRLVPIPDEPPAQRDRALRSHEEALRLLAETTAGRQIRGTFQGGGGGGGQQVDGSGAEVLCRGAAVGLCGIFDFGLDHIREYSGHLGKTSHKGRMTNSCIDSLTWRAFGHSSRRRGCNVKPTSAG